MPSKLRGAQLFRTLELPEKWRDPHMFLLLKFKKNWRAGAPSVLFGSYIPEHCSYPGDTTKQSRSYRGGLGGIIKEIKGNGFERMIHLALVPCWSPSSAIPVLDKFHAWGFFEVYPKTSKKLQYLVSVSSSKFKPHPQNFDPHPHLKFWGFLRSKRQKPQNSR